jgi:hypothetical protein
VRLVGFDSSLWSLRSSSQTEDQFASSEGVRTAEGSEAKKNKARFGFVASPALPER